MQFEKYPFEKLNELLKNVKPNSKYSEINLTIGEPQFETPDFIQEALKENTNLLKKYPKSAGEQYLKESMQNFFKNRFKVELQDDEIIPTLGTREVLFNFPQYLLSNKKNPKMAFTNPFYQIYEGAAIASKAKVVYIDLIPENGFYPSIDEKELEDTNLVILNFPNNPTGAILNFAGFQYWIELSQKYDFVLLNDECYSEIYFEHKPLSLLEVAKDLGIDDFKNLLVVNSLSKRSSAPGLRSGFIAGDKNILKGYAKYRTYLGTAIPLPLQIASAKAWSDEKHVEKQRKIYRQNMSLAKHTLQVFPKPATFYLWVPVQNELVQNELDFTKKLYEEFNIKVLPGRFLGRNGIGQNFVRIALVETPEKIEKALQLIKTIL